MKSYSIFNPCVIFVFGHLQDYCLDWKYSIVGVPIDKKEEGNIVINIEFKYYLTLDNIKT